MMKPGNSSASATPGRGVPGSVALVAMMLGLAPLASRAEDGISLPEWTESDALRFEEPGSVLLGGGLWPVELQPIPEPSLGERPEGFSGSEPGMNEAPRTEIEVPRIVIRRGGAEESSLDSEGEFAWGPTGVVPEEFHAAYFGERPRAPLVDAQRLLSEQKTNDLSRFLEYHDGESDIMIYTLIFGGRQELPPGVSLRELHSRWFGDEQVVLLAYFLGEPKHSILEFGKSGTEALGRGEIGEILDSCIEEARVASNGFNQLERFCIELSIRLYWVERTNAMGAGSEAVAASENGSNAEAGDGMIAAASGRARFATLSLIGCALALAGLGFLARHVMLVPGRSFVFPVDEITPRLSAPHSGGAHAVMYFGKKGN